jgi:NAD+ synthetase
MIGTQGKMHPRLQVDAEALAQRLVTFLDDVVRRRYGFPKAILGISGGVDSATVAHLAARALGPDNVIGLRLPYRDLGGPALEHAQLVIDALGLASETVDITEMVEVYSERQPGMDWHRRGNVQARVRMVVLFDKMVQYQALPLGTGNRSEILFGYFTQHGDDSPQVNPIGDLYKTQVRQLAEFLGVPREIVEKAPSAGLEPNQTDEGDFGMPYATVDLVLAHIEGGYRDEEIRGLGVAQDVIDEVRRRVLTTHRKRVPTLIPQVQPAPPDPTLFLRG